jgi:uncharacterized membrane protein YdjX (TVP38/TMEM64 family)
LVGVLIGLCRCFGVFLGKLTGETGIIGLFENICAFMLAPRHMRDWLACAVHQGGYFDKLLANLQAERRPRAVASRVCVL